MKLNIKDVFQYIDEQLDNGNKVTVQELAGHFQVTRRWLSELCRREAAITLQEYIKQKELSYWQKYLTLKYEEPLKMILSELRISRSTYYRRLIKCNQKEIPINSSNPPAL